MGEAKALKPALLLCPGFPREQAGKEECVRGDQAGTGAPPVLDPAVPPSTVAGVILGDLGWGWQIALEVLNDEALGPGLWGYREQVRAAWRRTQGPAGSFSTEASWLFSWQARQVSPPNSMTGPEPAFWEVGQIVPKAQAPSLLQIGRGRGRGTARVPQRAAWVGVSWAGGSRQVQGCRCWGRLTSGPGAAQSGGKPMRMGEQRAGGPWKMALEPKTPGGRGGGGIKGSL